MNNTIRKQMRNFTMRYFLFILIISLSSITLHADTSNTEAYGSLEMHIIASEENMANGFFTIEFRETISSQVTSRVLNFGDQRFENIKTGITPVIDESVGTAEKDYKEIRYSFQAEGSVSYGYTVTPQMGIFGSGYCDENLGIWDLYLCIPSNLNNFSDVTAYFDIPEGMNVYVPWEKTGDSNRIYKIVGVGSSSSYGYQISLAVWGRNFSDIDSLSYGNHTFYMIGYDDVDVTNVFKIMKATYEYIMPIFENHLEFLPPVNVVVMLPDYGGGQGGNNYGSASEGLGGFYNPNWGGNEWEPTGEYQGYSDGYLNVASNLNMISVNGIHCIVHSTLNPLHHQSGDWWMTEGIAVYNQIDMFYKMGIYNEAFREREFLEHLKYYQNGLVADSKLDGTNIHWIAYKKSALFFYMVDKLIRENTGGEQELRDFWILYYDKIAANSWKYNNKSDYYDLSIEILTQMTGENFRMIYDLYVFNSVPLPLEIENNEIFINFDRPIPLRANSSRNLYLGSGDTTFNFSFGDKLSLSLLFSSIEQEMYVIVGYYTYLVFTKYHPDTNRTFKNELCYLDITPSNNDCSAEIILEYTDELLEESDIDEANLVICRYNDGFQYWESLPTTIDTENNIVNAVNEHFSLFALVSKNERIVTNKPPEIYTIELHPAYEGSVYSDSLEVVDPDEDDTLTFELLGGPDWLTIDENGILAGTPTIEDNEPEVSVSIRICDLYGYADTLSTTMTIIPLNTVVNNLNQGEFCLNTPYPNPFNPTTTIKYSIPEESHVTIAIYNVSGQVVSVLKDEYQQAGNHSIIWNATGVSSGLYFSTLKANGFTETRKMVLVK